MALALDKLTHLRIPLEDVRKATDNFHKDNIISTGGFGPAYKGSLLWSGKRVKIATRRLDRRYGLGEFEFWTEVSVLSDLKYPNIVSMIGYCDEQDEKIIITEYVAKGSLERFLNRPNLTWTQRLQICIGVARALSYLHCGDGRDYVVIHRNINSYTILLDENWEPKLSGFEISVKQSVNRIDQVFLCELIGEEGYMDPDIEKTRGLTCKSDMYSFGVVLFEILCRRLALIENDANSFLAPFAKNHYEKETLKDIVHPDLWIQMSPWSLVKYSKSAYSCLEEEQAYRPDMGYIVVELNEALEFQLTRENLGKHFDHLKIPLTNILLATENFSERYSISNNGYHAFYRVEMHRFDDEFSSYVVGKDKDKVPQRHNTVIIKRLLVSNSKQREKVFNTEIQMLTSVKHPKIVTLFGFCFEATEMILVIANFSNGYLEAALQDVNKKSIMTWEKRLKICIDVAQALNYIHFELEEQKTIINHDIRCAYIMLDEKYVAKIAEFGLAVVLPPNQDDEALYHDKKSGSRYYRDPEYEQSGKLKRESDVYSFGVVMFEILFGRIASDPIYRKESGEGLAFVARRCFNMGMLEYMIDPIIKDQIGENDLIIHRGPNKDSLKTFVEIAYKCIAKTQDRRPSMKIILKQLQKSLFLQEKGVQSIVMEQLVDKQGEVLELQSRETPGKHLEHLKIPLANIQLATNNFSERYSISNNGYHAFYRAEMHHFDNEFSSYVGGKDKDKVPQRHNTVIIKRLLVSNMKQREKVFNTEIQMLTSVKHPKIVTLLGFCFEATEMILVIENFSNGFLGATLQHVNEKSILTWEKRLKICIDVAQALNYIHSEREEQMTIINRDIRCDYIMLDENYVAKIAEFGLAVVLPSNQDDKALYHNVTSGTSWYKDPEYRNTGKLKRESDVYSFGVVLFEILFGRKAYDPIYLKESDEGLAFVARRYFNMGTLEDMIDPIIQGEVGDNSILDRGSNKDSLRTFIEIAYKCIAKTQDE